MLQVAAPATVLGDFGRGTLTLRQQRYVLQADAGQYHIRGPFPRDSVQDHRVDYTLGSRRVQHYLTTLSDGRIVVLPPTWDVERREWFHNLDIVNPDEAAQHPVQVWNMSCFSCHVSQQEKNYDAAKNTYATTWTDRGTNCERCHGPGGAHADQYQRRRDEASPVTGRARPGGSRIVVPSKLSAEKGSMVCAQCHSLRDITIPGFAAGGDYYDHFTPILEYGQKGAKDPAYWVDGRPRRFSNDAIGLWQSRCFLDGKATCTTCHDDPHEPNIERHEELAPSNNALCTRCHESIGADLPRHTRHKAGSAANACVECHMPKTVVSLRTTMRDHTMSVPAPENTVSFGIPNACTVCHQEKPAAWAVDALARWYPNGRRMQLVAQAEAFTRGRVNAADAIPRLEALARDRQVAPLVRANAISYLRTFSDPRAAAVLLDAARGEHPVIRAAAVLGLGDQGVLTAAVRGALLAALRDDRGIVRLAAALSLVNLGVTPVEGEDGRRFAAAKRDYLSRAELWADDPAVQLDAGKLHLVTREVAAASRALEASLRIDSTQIAPRYFLALTRLAQRRPDEARKLLGEIPAADPFGPAARKLLDALASGK